MFTGFIIIMMMASQHQDSASMSFCACSITKKTGDLLAET